MEISRIPRCVSSSSSFQQTLVIFILWADFFGNILPCRSAALSWLPGSFLFVGNIYAGSRALSHMVGLLSPPTSTRRFLAQQEKLEEILLLRLFPSPVQEIPFFFTLQNSSHVVSCVILKVAYGEVSSAASAEAPGWSGCKICRPVINRRCSGCSCSGTWSSWSSSWSPGAAPGPPGPPGAAPGPPGPPGAAPGPPGLAGVDEITQVFSS